MNDQFMPMKSEFIPPGPCQGSTFSVDPFLLFTFHIYLYYIVLSVPCCFFLLGKG